MSLLERVAALEAEVKQATAKTAEEVERFRVAMLGRNGAVTELFDAFKQVSADEKRALGQRLNQLKQAAKSASTN
jgi:phenylalanyl-tRNA synthetase alpha chain